MISYKDYAQQILLGEFLEDKLIDVNFEWSPYESFALPFYPGRSGPIKFSHEKHKFPKASRLGEPDKKAMAIHSFANHELLAIEMMAAALLIYPHETEEDIRFKRGIVTTIKDEQKHLTLYIKRLNELGYAFGDFALNDFFWRQMEKLETASQYTALMALTFEAANLDFAQYYSKIFKSLGDNETAAVLDLVLEDEISHVAFGAHWLKRWKQDKTLWDYYRESLPYPLTPARGRGIEFDVELHRRAMSEDDFIKQLESYDDDYLTTKRISL